MEQQKSAFVAIVGRPNAGKSSLMNSLLGQKVVIVSDKPQTTRTRIMGVLTENEYQYVFIDTPGIHRPQNRLGDYMVTAAKSGMQQGDVVMLVVDVNKPVSKTELEVIEYLKREGVPSILVLNKIDTVRREMIAEKIAAYASKHEFDAVIPVVAKSGKHVDEVMDELSKFLHESEWFFPEDAATDQPMRQYVSEIIREKLLRALDREVPHGIAVVIEEYRDTGNLTKIRAEIICEKQSHKQIIIGKGGEVLKKVGMYSREELEKLTGSKIFLDLWVRVKENWREREGLVSNFGYNKKDID